MIHVLVPYYQDGISSGIFSSAGFLLLHLFTHNKPKIINAMNTNRRTTVTPVATKTAVVVGTAEQRSI